MLNPKRREPIPDSEMKRRQDLVISVLDKAGADAVVMYNSGDMCGGVFRWATDKTNYYPLTALLCKEGIAFFQSGNNTPDDADIPFVSIGDQLPIRVWSCPYLPATTFSRDRYGAAMVNFIKSRGFKKIAWGGLSYVSATLYRYLLKNLPDVEFIDLTEELDDVRLVKSPWEIEQFQRCVDLHDKLIRFCETTIRPDLTPHQLDNAIMSRAAELGAIEFNTQLIKCWRSDSDPIGDYEQLRKGDYIWVLIEVAANSGEWGECARLFRLGEEPEQKWIDLSDKVIEIQHKIAERCVPGAIPEDIFEYCKQLQREAGMAEEPRFCIHGQSYDIVDLPLFVEGDRKPLKENMFFVIHPAYMGKPPVFDPPYFNYTDNYIVKSGGAVKMSHTPQKIITVSI